MSELIPGSQPDSIVPGNTPSAQSDGFRAAIQEAVKNLSGIVHFPKELESIREILSSEKVKKTVQSGINSIASALVVRIIQYNKLVQKNTNTKPCKKLTQSIDVVFNDPADIGAFVNNEHSLGVARGSSAIQKRALVFSYPELQEYTISNLFITAIGGPNNRYLKYDESAKEFYFMERIPHEELPRGWENDKNIDRERLVKTTPSGIRISFDLVKNVTEADREYVNKLLQGE